jgi:large subunit ribosomal protein L9
MKVILRKDIEQLGKVGQLVDVKDGYALNYLIPRGFAYVAVKGNVKAIVEEKKILEKRDLQELKNAQQLASDLEKISVTIPVQVGEEDKIFGTVTSQMIADSLLEKGYEIDKRKIDLDETIKTLGIYTANIKLHPSVNAKIKVWVVRE